MHPVWWVVIMVPVAILLLYILFQKKLLPSSLNKLSANLFFYPSLPFTLTCYTCGCRGAYWHQIDTRVWLGGVPLKWAGHVDELHRMSVKAVVNMCDEFNANEAEYEKLGIEQLYLPTVDHTEPTEYDLKRAVVFIEAALTKHAEVGGQVYIHCKSGHGRGAAVAFCWLLYHQKLGLEDAQRELAASGRSIRKKLYQQKNITAFYEHSVA